MLDIFCTRLFDIFIANDVRLSLNERKSTAKSEKKQKQTNMCNEWFCAQHFQRVSFILEKLCWFALSKRRTKRLELMFFFFVNQMQQY